MSEWSEHKTASMESLSALADGEIDAAAAARACAQWRDDEAARQRWHAYQLIGDVLRSDDLAQAPQRDRSLLGAVRARLAAEPVVLAPCDESRAEGATVPSPRMQANATPRRRWAWMGSAAVAAGFVAVAGMLVVTREPSPPGASTLAQVAPVSSSPSLVSSASAVQRVGLPSALAESSAEPPALVASGKLIRDARLDQYLAAHKQFAGSSALGVPSGFLRSATTDAPSR